MVYNLPGSWTTSAFPTDLQFAQSCRDADHRRQSTQRLERRVVDLGCEPDLLTHELRPIVTAVSTTTRTWIGGPRSRCKNASSNPPGWCECALHGRLVRFVKTSVNWQPWYAHRDPGRQRGFRRRSALSEDGFFVVILAKRGERSRSRERRTHCAAMRSRRCFLAAACRFCTERLAQVDSDDGSRFAPAASGRGRTNSFSLYSWLVCFRHGLEPDSFGAILEARRAYLQRILQSVSRVL